MPMAWALLVRERGTSETRKKSELEARRDDGAVQGAGSITQGAGADRGHRPRQAASEAAPAERGRGAPEGYDDPASDRGPARRVERLEADVPETL